MNVIKSHYFVNYFYVKMVGNIVYKFTKHHVTNFNLKNARRCRNTDESQRHRNKENLPELY